MANKYRVEEGFILDENDDILATVDENNNVTFDEDASQEERDAVREDLPEFFMPKKKKAAAKKQTMPKPKEEEPEDEEEPMPAFVSVKEDAIVRWLFKYRRKEFNRIFDVKDEKKGADGRLQGSASTCLTYCVRPRSKEAQAAMNSIRKS